tara:strand:+ start:147 stop:314 length:168 start_codon:yes stop_codon:yes gene_type:complete
MKFIITTFDKNGKALTETTRHTKEGLDIVLAEVVRDMNSWLNDVDTFTVVEKDAV